MRGMRRVFALALTTLLVGCGTTGAGLGGQGGAVETDTGGGELSALERAAVRSQRSWLEANDAMNTACRDQAARYDELTNTARERASKISTFSLIASSIIAPAYAAKTGVAKSASIAVGGLAGASAGYLAADDQYGRSPRALATAHAEFLSELKTRTDFLRKEPRTLDVELGFMRNVILWCAAATPNPAVAEAQEEQKRLSDVREANAQVSRALELVAPVLQQQATQLEQLRQQLNQQQQGQPQTIRPAPAGAQQLPLR